MEMEMEIEMEMEMKMKMEMPDATSRPDGLMHTCMYAYMHSHMHICMYAYMHTCIYAYMHICIYFGVVFSRVLFCFLFSAGDGRASGRDGQGTCSHGAFGLPHGYGVLVVVVLPDYLGYLAIFLNLARLPSTAGGVCRRQEWPDTRPYADAYYGIPTIRLAPCMVAPIRKRRSPLSLPRFSL